MIISSFEIKTELLSDVEPKRFTPQGRFHYYIRIFLNAAPGELDKVELVKYTLHTTFIDPIRVSADRANSFEIKIWSYGYFDIKALLIMRAGNTMEVKGEVRWPIPAGMPFDDG